MAKKGMGDLQDIKRLLILLLMKVGASSEEIGAALGVDSSRVRQMLPARKVRKLTLGGSK